jgi:hypothetical protein
MKRILCKILALFFLSVIITTVQAQQSKQAIMAKLSALQDDFTHKIAEMGYKHSLKYPPIVLDNPRSFGNYGDSTNVLHTGYWPTLPAEDKAAFTNIAKNAGKGISTERFFELVVHQWIFVHELGHWWRACQHVTADPYENEKAANRIAAAYWNARDPAFYKFMLNIFSNVIEHRPSPVPAGISKEKYLKDNYNKLPGGAAYSWYQSIMNVEIGKEKPFETFKQAVAMAGKRLN